jgi:hypothetical protein
MQIAEGQVLSKELQMGKAGEHLVCADLIYQGFSAFLADQGLPYDVVVDVCGSLKRIQVRTTSKLISYEKAKDVYRFGTRCGKRGIRAVLPSDYDYFAFVALPEKKIAYFSKEEMTTRGGRVKQTVDLKTKSATYAGRVYSNGTRRTPEWGRYIEDFQRFKP